MVLTTHPELKIDVSIMLEIWGVNITLGTLWLVSRNIFWTIQNNLHLRVSLWSILHHSVPRVKLTPKISKVNQISIFILGWVVGITPYAQFCPIPSPFLLIFSKNGFEVKLNIENWQKHPKLLM